MTVRNLHLYNHRSNDFDMVYFTEKLINEIRQRSCIWDTADVNHLNKEVLTNMWTEIAGNLYSDWHSLNSFDKRDRGKQKIIIIT